MVKNILLACVLTAAGGYLLGSILFGVLISKVMYNDDVRNHGSGNAGMTNVLRTYGKLPLIEPLESREVKKIHDFVIVVDTSESTAGELVKAFLKETFTLLKSQDSFFRQCRILVMQADNAVRDEVWLNDLDALDRYTAQFTLVGGGGKTTLLYAFARHCAAKGWRVLVSTTTHIRQPGENYAADEAALAALWAAGQYAVAGVPAEQGKLTALPPEQLTRWMAQADIVLLEADGAKRMPCKAPAAHEPVLLPESDVVLAVAGLSALGRPLREVCFRLEQACALLGAAPETLLTPELLARLLASEQGGRKQVGEPAVFLWCSIRQSPRPHCSG